MASSITILESKTDHCEPGRTAVMVCSGSATHPSRSTSRWCSKYSQSTRRFFCGKAKMHGPRPHCFFLAALYHQNPWPSPQPKFMLLDPNFPQHICPSQLFFPLWHHWRTSPSPPSDESAQKKSAVSFMTFFGITKEEKRAGSDWPVAALLHLSLEYNNNARVTVLPAVLWDERYLSHHVLVL